MGRRRRVRNCLIPFGTNQKYQIKSRWFFCFGCGSAGKSCWLNAGRPTSDWNCTLGWPLKIQEDGNTRSSAGPESSGEKKVITRRRKKKKRKRRKRMRQLRRQGRSGKDSRIYNFFARVFSILYWCTEWNEPLFFSPSLSFRSVSYLRDFDMMACILVDTDDRRSVM